MGNPTKGDVHVNTPLTNISIAYLQDATNFVASRVFPNIPVTKQGDRYYTYNRGDFNRDEMKKRAPGTQSAGGGYKIDSSPTYFAEVYAFHKDIPDQTRSNADSSLNLDREATEYCSTKALIKREKLFAGNYFATGVWTNELVGAAAAVGGTSVIYWSSADSTPIEDVRLAKRTILRTTGMVGNTLVLGSKVYDDLLDHPEIIERIDRGQTPVGPALAGVAKLMAIFEVERIFVMNAIENTQNEITGAFTHDSAAEGTDYTHAFIGGNHALLCHSAPRPGLLTASAGYTFSWTGYLGAGAEGNRMSKFYMKEIKSDRIEIEMAFDQKLVSADLGFMFLSVVAADA